ncbi:hypothetical protein IFT90_15645 [Frigoribacterium sp. CFBP 8766]|uniref:hypothetical protein n=1 Tax=Frigoribacterium sp. CFBP 8766 TaxID=2775273 RepID=UPI00177B5105|nr:hypothetical protein [Frigoribacterium sp. CFBP 8766]MBD8585989.1 hypothetical protein [Frigoribacterium sp. CFBP 8766]
MIALVAVTSGCSSPASPEPTPTPTGAPLTSYVGLTFDSVTSKLRPDTTVVVQDLSVLVGKDPTYTQIAFGSPEWDVVAICADQEMLEEASSVEVAIVPVADASPSFLNGVREGEQKSTVTCEGRPYR